MLLARLAIANSWQGKGLAAGLLKDAVLHILQAAEIACIRAFAVHAKDDEAKAFYEHFDFVPSPSDPYHLFRLLKGIRGFLKAWRFTEPEQLRKILNRRLPLRLPLR